MRPWPPITPSLIYVSISGYGQRGPWRHRRAYAPFVHAETGYLHTVAQLRQAPLEHDPMSIADLAAGKDATIAVLAALVERQRSGNGCYIDMSLAHSILFFNEFATALLNPKGRPPKSGSTPQTIFVTADGQGFSAGNPVSGQVFAPLCRALGCTELIDDARFVDSGARRQRRAELISALQDAVDRRGTIDEIEQAINAEGLVTGRVRAVPDVVETEWVAERGAVMSVSSEAGEELLIPSAPVDQLPDGTSGWAWRGASAPTTRKCSVSFWAYPRATSPAGGTRRPVRTDGRPRQPVPGRLGGVVVTVRS